MKIKIVTFDCKRDDRMDIEISEGNQEGDIKIELGTEEVIVEVRALMSALSAFIK